MKITHIFHSGFMVEMEKSVLLFDWYTGKLPEIPAKKRLYVFCSHAHEDHYSPMIWGLSQSHPDVVYILDDGIPDAAGHPEAEVALVSPHQTYEIHDLLVRTLTSNDMGVAFYVEAEGKRVYHAGDLNVWYWSDREEAFNIASEKMCRGELQSLADAIGERGASAEEEAAKAGDAKRADTVLSSSASDAARNKGGKKPLLDVAFALLDPRLGPEAPRCIESLMQILGAEYVFPMHYWEREEEARSYLSDLRLCPYADRIHFDAQLVIE